MPTGHRIISWQTYDAHSGEWQWHSCDLHSCLLLSGALQPTTHVTVRVLHWIGYRLTKRIRVLRDLSVHRQRNIRSDLRDAVSSAKPLHQSILMCALRKNRFLTTINNAGFDIERGLAVARSRKPSLLRRPSPSVSRGTEASLSWSGGPP